MSDPEKPTNQATEAERKVPAQTPVNLGEAHKKVKTDGRKVAGKILSVLIIFSAMVLALYVWSIIERHPRTDDATVRANVVGIAPRVRGQIIKVHVQDNQAV